MNDLLGSVPINAALFGYTSLALLYFVLGETFYGTTLGKWPSVSASGRAGSGPPGHRRPPAQPPEALDAHAPRRLGIFVVILVQRGATIAISLTGGVDLAINAGYPIVAFLLFGLAVLGAISGVAMHFTPERQRFGDLLADTWVVLARRLRGRWRGGAVGGGPVRVSGIAIDETFASRPSRFTSRSVSIVMAPTVTWPSRKRRRTTSTTSTALPITLPRALTSTVSVPLWSCATTSKT